jgi:hypothetical protein
MRQKSKTCNRRYLFPRTHCQASSYIDGDARAALREIQDLEGAEGHSNFGILSSFNSSPARTIRASLFIHEKLIHLGSRPARDKHWVDLVGADLASSRRAVSHSARRSLALPFLFAIFRRQFPPAEPSLLNQYHLPWYFEINRDHHLRPLAEGNRQ